MCPLKGTMYVNSVPYSLEQLLVCVMIALSEPTKDEIQ